jgi:hypothetical protein
MNICQQKEELSQTLLPAPQSEITDYQIIPIL